MKIISYNVNGIRSAISKGFLEWLPKENPDIICLQEIKAQPDQIPLLSFLELGYQGWWHSAKKPGYSGVAILSRQEPDHVEVGMQNSLYDSEGRILRVDFGDVSVMSLYIPSGSSGELRQEFKMEFLNQFLDYILMLKQNRKKLIICGDYNICHQPIDIHDPVRNANSSGFLPEERAWLTKFINAGFTDSFRYVNHMPHQYSWWSFRANARNNNKGWRIDYNMVSDSLADNIAGAGILPQVVHSDHCPVWVELKG
jgi:exodeoxyribonuclease III